MSNIQSLFSLHGKAAFVSEAPSGVGLHVAELMAEAGAKVVLAARRASLLEAHMEWSACARPDTLHRACRWT